jgi:hypothetical protein
MRTRRGLGAVVQSYNFIERQKADSGLAALFGKPLSLLKPTLFSQFLRILMPDCGGGAGGRGGRGAGGLGLGFGG